jgi:hypothetical protein
VSSRPGRVAYAAGSCCLAARLPCHHLKQAREYLEAKPCREIMNISWDGKSPLHFTSLHSIEPEQYRSRGLHPDYTPLRLTSSQDPILGNAVILSLLRFGVEKFGTVFHGPGDFGLSPKTSVFGVPAPLAVGEIDGASMPNVLESPRS